MSTCTLTDFISWFVCAQTVGPVAEVLCLVVFVAFFSYLKQGDNLRGALVPSLLLATLAAAAFYGMGVIGPALTVAGILLTALSAAFLRSQNNPY